MPKKEKNHFHKTIFGRILRWVLIPIFIITLIPALFFYNIHSAASEKNIKKLGEEIVRDVLYQNQESIDENYDLLVEFAKLMPEENLEFPTGIEEIVINIQANEFSELSREEFYDKIPVIVSDNMYRETLDHYINTYIQENEAVPVVARNIFGEFNKDNTKALKTLYIIFGIISFVTAILYMLCSNKGKGLIVLGISAFTLSFTPFLVLKFSLPALNGVIRKSEFSTIASLTMSMFEKMQANYLYFSLFSLFIFIIGVAMVMGFKPKSFKVKKKDKYEKIIKA